MADAATTSITREQLLAFGQAGRPWAFLGIAARALEQAPEDQGLRFLVSANLARLGLKSLAGEQLDALPIAAQGHPDIAALRGALAGLPSDRVGIEELVAVCARNVAALEARGVRLRELMARWVAGLAEWECWRALDGNAVRRRAGKRGLADVGLTDQVGAAERFAASVALDKPASIILEGVDPPWMLRKVHERTPRQALGYRPPLLVVQADAMELLDGLSLADLTGVLSDSRVRVFVGPDASERLGEWLAGRVDYQISSLFVPLATTRTRATPEVQGVIERALSAQEAVFARLKARVEAVYAGRDEAWWARRYRAAAAGGEALRVLVPTCRYSTFIKHSAADLCEAIRRAGHEAELYCEPDDTTKLSGAGYLRQFDRMRPDLVVLINYPRACMGGAMPANVPFVCWVQDSMSHLFDEMVGAAQGPLDFLIGHTFLELFQKYGYPTARAMPISVVADEAKFSPTRNAERGTRNEPASDVAFVSHHSETPRAMHERLCREGAGAPEVVRAFELMYPEIEAAVAGAREYWAAVRIQEAAAARVREAFGREPDQRTLTLVMRQYAMPLADRMLRHQTLEWAAAVARRRGWSLAIYGRGWGSHPTLAEFAEPELEHGDALRDCYARTGAHLHVAASTLTHQRVIECYLSGGLCLCRMHRDAIAGARLNAQLALLERSPDVVEDERIGYMIADHAEAMALADSLAAAGEPYVEPVLWISKARALSHRRFRDVLAADQDPTFLLRDLSETTFSNERELEELLERAIERPAWRAAVSGMVAARARAYLTHDAMVRRMMGLVRGSLGAGALREAV